MVPVRDNDLNLSFSNPSLLNRAVNDQLTFNYSKYFADIAYTNVAYARKYKKHSMFSLGLNYLVYGSFDKADETGRITGVFTGKEYAVQLSGSQQIDSFFTFGATVKFISSELETYRSYGLATDLGISYYQPAQIFTATLLLRNLGRQLKSYYPGGENEALPFEVELGISKKLAHAPFHFHLVAQHLEKFDLTYDNPNDSSQPVDPASESTSGTSKLQDFADKTLRHIIIGVEFVPSRNFFVDFSYNFQRGKEMQVETKPGFVGFSWGVGMKINKFRFSFARSTYHIAGSTNHFSISTCPMEFIRFKRSNNS